MSSPRRTPGFRRSTWYMVILLVLVGCYLELVSHEMHLSKVLFFASFGVWARDMARPWRGVQLGMSVALCLAVLATWYQYRHQHLVPISPGAYRLADK